MDFEMVMLRTIHIVVGAFWAGTAIFFAFIMTPQLQKLGPPIMDPVMGALAPVMAKVMLTTRATCQGHSPGAAACPPTICGCGAKGPDPARGHQPTPRDLRK